MIEHEEKNVVSLGLLVTFFVAFNTKLPEHEEQETILSMLFIHNSYYYGAIN